MVIDTLVVKLSDTLKRLPNTLVKDGKIGADAPNKKNDLPSIQLLPKQISVNALGIGGRILKKDSEDVMQTYEVQKAVGIIQIIVWANTTQATGEIALALDTLLSDSKNDLRRQGVVFIQSDGWAEEKLVALKATGSLSAIRKTLNYKVVYEHIPDTPVGDGIINTVKVGMTLPLEESMEITKS